MPKFSVIVPVYNAEKYLADCMDSIRRQTLGDIEVIAVDDGSADRSGGMLDAFAAEDPRIRVIHKKNAGVGAARNDGLAAASGEYVLFCDSDDLMEPDACEVLYDAGVRRDADVVVGDVYRILEGEKVYAQFWAHPFAASRREARDILVRTDFSKKYCHAAPEGGPAFGYGGPWNKAVRREFLERTGIHFETSLQGIFDDILYTAYLYAEAGRVVYVTAPVYDYRILDDSVTHSYKENILSVNRAIFDAWEEFLKKYGPDGRYDEAYDALVIRRLKGTLGTYFFNEKNPESIGEQKLILKEMFHTEPYRHAIQNADPKKLSNSYDLAVWAAAKAGSPDLMQAVYVLYRIVKKVKK